MRLTVQLYTVRDALASDFEGSLSALADMGLEYVELAGQWQEAGFADQLSARGLKASGSHVGLDQLKNDYDHVTGAHRALGVDLLIMPWTSGDFWRDEQASFRADMAEMGAKLKADGFTWAFHNHDHEVKNGGLISFFDGLENVDAQLDLGWVYVAGEDPTDYVNRFASRLSSVHVKDKHADGRDAIAGEGGLDFAAIIPALEAANVRFAGIEMDTPPNDPIQDVAACVKFFHAHGLR